VCVHAQPFLDILVTHTHVIRDYNNQNHEVLKGDGGARVIICKEGEISESKYINAAAGTAVSVDHVKVCMCVFMYALSVIWRAYVRGVMHAYMRRVMHAYMRRVMHAYMRRVM
jgi:hypothetical protein